MKRIVFRPEAEADLFELYRYIARASGALRNDVKAGLRILIHERKTIIAYFVTGGSVIISNIFHAGRDWETDLLHADEPPPPPKE